MNCVSGVLRVNAPADQAATLISSRGCGRWADIGHRRLRPVLMARGISCRSPPACDRWTLVLGRASSPHACRRSRCWTRVEHRSGVLAVGYALRLGSWDAAAARSALGNAEDVSWPTPTRWPQHTLGEIRRQTQPTLTETGHHVSANDRAGRRRGQCPKPRTESCAVGA